MIHTRNATLIHFKQSIKTICRIHNPSAKKRDGAILMLVQSYFHPFFNFPLNQLESVHLYK